MLRPIRSDTRLSAGADQDQPVAGKVRARAALHEAGLFHIVHPVFVGGQEQVGGGSGANLPCERGGPCKGEDGARMAACGPGISRSGHRLLHARGGQ